MLRIPVKLFMPVLAVAVVAVSAGVALVQFSDGTPQQATVGGLVETTPEEPTVIADSDVPSSAGDAQQAGATVQRSVVGRTDETTHAGEVPFAAHRDEQAVVDAGTVEGLTLFTPDSPAAIFDPLDVSDEMPDSLSDVEETVESLTVPVTPPFIVPADVSNVHSVSDGNSYVYAGVSLTDRSVTVRQVDRAGQLWSHTLPARASYHFDIGLDISGSYVAAGGRRHHPIGGFGALFKDGELLWHHNLTIAVRDVALYDSGESVWVGWNPVTNAAAVVFMSAAGDIVWEQDYLPDFPSAFANVELVGTTVVLRGVNLCVQQGVCTASAEQAFFVVLDQEGAVVTDTSAPLSHLFDISPTGFRMVYPWLTGDGFVAGPNGYVLSGLALTVRGDYCLVLAGLDYSFAPVWRSGPVFCEDGAELFENRGALTVTTSGDAVVAVGTYYGADVAGASSGSIDFVAAIIGPQGIAFATQFGTQTTDHPHDISLFDGNMLLSGDTWGGGVLAFVDVGGGLSSFRAGSVSPNWYVPYVPPVILTPEAPSITHIGVSASGLAITWEPSPTADVSYYQADVTDEEGVQVTFCRSGSKLINGVVVRFPTSCETGVLPNGTYTVTVFGVNRHGDGATDQQAVRVNIGVPSAPRNVTGTTLSHGRLSVSYDTPASNGGASVSRYHLEVYRDGVLFDVRRNARNKRSFPLGGVGPGFYEFRVAAQNARGMGEWSAFQSVTIP
jgi:hypothetical protein